MCIRASLDATVSTFNQNEKEKRKHLQMLNGMQTFDACENIITNNNGQRKLVNFWSIQSIAAWLADRAATSACLLTRKYVAPKER